jgi:hypothetical protein
VKLVGYVNGELVGTGRISLWIVVYGVHSRILFDFVS